MIAQLKSIILIPINNQIVANSGFLYSTLYSKRFDSTTTVDDVNCIPSLRINMSDDIFTLQDDSNNRSRKSIACSKSNIADGIDLLGKEVVVEWNSKQWRGKVTKVMKDNDYFVFIEYDNGDQSWCDLQNENSWAIAPEHNESSSGLLHARTRSSKIVEKEEKGDDISYSNRNNSQITAATTTTTNNKKQKYYHDHYQQQPLVAEEQEEKRMHKARKEDHYNAIPSQSRSPPALHIEYPDQNDILFGRGWDIQKRPGNLLFRQVLESYLTDYNKLESRKVKSTFACAITSELKERHHCRFLMKDPTHIGGWHEVTDTVARQKVSSGFRDIRKAHVKNYNSRCEQEGIKIDKTVEYDSDDNDDDDDDDDDGDWVQGN